MPSNAAKNAKLDVTSEPDLEYMAWEMLLENNVFTFLLGP
jgi:hypothetical protein